MRAAPAIGDPERTSAEELDLWFDHVFGIQPNSAEACVRDGGVMLDNAREWDRTGYFGEMKLFWPYWPAPIALGLLMIGAAWVRRGFQSHPS